ncbi:protein kinase [uncultured Legionella sp.]|uniref:protein kinase domain-containing protein n=1 Tax=uncultured Legionella sp. TaxID=210934 RepID=UPI002604B8A4|nr:protein kinase [uncultured Legionella sp.]
MSKKKHDKSTQTKKILSKIVANIDLPYVGSDADRRYLLEFKVELQSYLDEINENIKAYNKAVGDSNSAKMLIAKNEIESLIMEAIYSFPPDFSSAIPSVQQLFEQRFPELLQTINSSGDHLLSGDDNKAKKKVSYFDKLKHVIASVDDKKVEIKSNALLNKDKSSKNGIDKEFEFFFGKESAKKGTILKLKDKTSVALTSTSKTKESKPSEKTKEKNEIKQFILEHDLNNLDNLQELKNKISSYKSHHDLSFSRKLFLKALVSHIEKKIGVLLIQNANDTKVGPKLADCNFPELLAKMPADKVAELAALVAKGKGCKINDLTSLLKGIYEKDTPEYLQMQEFLANHKLEFLGGGNSKNFKVSNIYTGNSYVLKLDNRLNAPKQMEAKLMVELKATMTPIHAERQTTFKDEKGQLATRVLLMTEYCAGGDLESDAKKQPASNKLKAAVGIYRQMAETLETIRKTGVLFPDLKNTNWLIDNERKLRIADTKSFLPATNGFYDSSNQENKWYNLLSTRYMNPPEFKSGEFKTDPVHAYQLGKNLYQYLTDCSILYLYEHGDGDGAQYNFNFPIFKTPEGLELRNIIEQSIKPDPKQRISVESMLATLSTLDKKLNPAPVKENENKKAPEIKVDQQGIANQQKMKVKLNEFQLADVTKLYKVSDASIQKVTQLLNKLETIQRSIDTKYDGDNEKYHRVHDTLQKEIGQIKNNWRVLQSNATGENLESFKDSCGSSVTKIADELAQHRGWWFSDVSAGVRAFIGVLATVTIVPAVVVALASNHGYTNTFFGTAKTGSLTQFEQLNITKDVDLTLDEFNDVGPKFR